ncbi:MAG: hypothetical protein CVT88_05910 [Candidatus Altiarchaeales archaeon HGW-Altiarchaeales-1]|nr:MAG: hypothetical protein CVT89_04165 [Candidatus Altiarchaeales archaeon HGW-Altiarchaeales-2]PKP59269.1 MAG: hypothetical protein CVT88_05910 [Candidatus Altiarchaeales archaeon HGW-Altiarchaeales-1]
MYSAGTYKLTRSDQITIPDVIRKHLKLHDGDLLDFFYSNDTVLLKKKKEPVEVFRSLAEKSRKEFKQKKITREDVETEIKAYRSENRK